MEDGNAQRFTETSMHALDARVVPSVTHEAWSLPGPVGVGTLSMRFTQLPADGGLPIDVHGVVDSTLVPVDGGSNVTFHAAF